MSKEIYISKIEGIPIEKIKSIMGIPIEKIKTIDGLYISKKISEKEKDAE